MDWGLSGGGFAMTSDAAGQDASAMASTIDSDQKTSMMQNSWYLKVRNQRREFESIMKLGLDGKPPSSTQMAMTRS